MKYRKLKTFVLSLATCACCASITLPATAFAAEEAEAAGVNISATCDDNVSLKSGDEFKITVKNSHTGVDEEILVDASEALDSVKRELTPGSYIVYDITYEGDNEDLKDETLAIPTFFNANADYDYVYFAVGEDSALNLQHDYSDVILKTAERSEELEKQNAENDKLYENEEMVDVGNGILPKEDYENEKPKDIADSSADVTVEVSESDYEAPVKETKAVENNYLIGIIPIAAIAVIGGLVLYLLKKNNKI